MLATFRGTAVRRRLGAALSIAALILQTGCYSYLPLQDKPPVIGTRVAVTLNDRGRVDLGDKLGPSVDRVEGSVARIDGDRIALDVYRTTDLRGSDANWSGERVEIGLNGVRGFQERQLSKKKSFVLAAVLIGTVVLSALTVNLSVFGDPKQDDPPAPPSDT
ncbi:MAG: hypothetical protein K2X99_08565 [Gemmatimonadaceae bacterium]|nr:hypothetical protein [Gemmatimonadaceae bacterium]